jgi:alpha-glucosidase
MRAHSVINEKNKEPWEYGDTFTAINRETINVRYRLLPAVYSVLAEAAETGLPAMRPMMFQYPDDSRFWNEETQFFFGENLLVAPVVWEGLRRRDVVLPRGVWYEFGTGHAIEGGKTISVDAPLEGIPYFARAGSVVPTQRAMEYVGQMPVDTLTLCVFPAESGMQQMSLLYEDDGSSFAYTTGVYARRTFTVRSARNTQICEVSAVQGSYASATHTLAFRFMASTTPPQRVTVDGKRIEQRTAAPASSASSWWRYSPSERRVDVYTHNLSTARRIELQYEH